MRRLVTGAVASLVVVAGLAVAPAAVAAPANNDRAADVVDHWTPQRLAAAEPRDLLIDERGLGYEREDDGRLKPHGHGRPAEIPAPTVVPTPERAAPQPTPLASAPRDTTAPTIGGMTPSGGASIGTAATFSATVTDTGGVRSVTFTLTAPNGRNTSYAANGGTNGLYQLSFSGFTAGSWSWTVKATDAKGNTRTSQREAFKVSTTPADPTLVTNQKWTGGAVQRAAGRIFFEMPDSSDLNGPWGGYVCSGTVVQDENSGQSVILTAAHCVYDDVNKTFARNVLFIPDQSSTTGVGTDTDCTNDLYGCWAPSYGVVDTDWTIRTFPANVEWDYAYYVVPTVGRHFGTDAGTDSLEQAVGRLPVQFSPPLNDVAGSTDRTHALGYSYSQDPNFMYCAEDMTTNGSVNWFLANCGLSGGASGGPWIQPMDTTTGTGPIISVNSWGYTNNRPGMAGPKLSDSSASTLLDTINAGTTVPLNGGVILD